MPASNYAGHSRPTSGTYREYRKPPLFPKGGLDGIFRFINVNMDAGDIILFMILLLLYMDSHDEEFLIIIAVLLLS